MLPECRAGDDEETLFGQTCDGEIAFDPTALVQALCINDRTNRLVNIVGADIVQESQRARPAYFKFIERGLIE